MAWLARSTLAAGSKAANDVADFFIGLRGSLALLIKILVGLTLAGSVDLEAGPAGPIIALEFEAKNSWVHFCRGSPGYSIAW